VVLLKKEILELSKDVINKSKIILSMIQKDIFGAYIYTFKIRYKYAVSYYEISLNPEGWKPTGNFSKYLLLSKKYVQNNFGKISKYSLKRIIFARELENKLLASSNSKQLHGIFQDYKNKLDILTVAKINIAL